MITIQFYNERFEMDPDYYTGKEDIYAALSFKDGAEVREKWDELLNEYEGETYSSWHDGKMTCGGAFDPDDVDAVADDGMERWTVENLIHEMQAMKPGDTITLAGWYEYGRCYYARIIQRVDTSLWGFDEDCRVWIVGKCTEFEQFSIITEGGEFLEEDVRAYLIDYDLLEDGGMVYVRV